MRPHLFAARAVTLFPRGRPGILVARVAPRASRDRFTLGCPLFGGLCQRPDTSCNPGEPLPDEGRRGHCSTGDEYVMLAGMSAPLDFLRIFAAQLGQAGIHFAITSGTSKEELVRAAIVEVAKLAAASENEIAQVLPPVDELLP